MLDKWTIQWAQPVLRKAAMRLDRAGISANQISMTGFVVGLGAIPALWMGGYRVALVFILINRCLDGLDGALARQRTASDAGGFLDITLDFIFYSGVIWGFALADPQRNALAAVTLVFAFIGTGSSFLAFAVMAARRNLQRIDYPYKSLYYLGGLTEGTETIIFLVLFCLFPAFFPPLAYIFAGLCWVTTLLRIIGGYRTLIRPDGLGGSDDSDAD
jgi:phosphatidylglycerophosphate synthase